MKPTIGARFSPSNSYATYIVRAVDGNGGCYAERVSKVNSIRHFTAEEMERAQKAPEQEEMFK